MPWVRGRVWRSVSYFCRVEGTFAGDWAGHSLHLGVIGSHWYANRVAVQLVVGVVPGGVTGTSCEGTNCSLHAGCHALNILTTFTRGCIGPVMSRRSAVNYIARCSLEGGTMAAADMHDKTASHHTRLL